MSSQRTVTCYIDKEDYELYLSLANLSSVSRNAVFAGELLIRGIQARREELTTEDRLALPPRAQLRLIELETRERLYDQETLNAIVSRGVDEDISDMLHPIMSELNLDEDAAVRFATESPFASSVAYNNNGTKGGRCQRWLAEVFTEREKMPRPIIIAAAEREGFGENLVNRASRKLGIIKKKGDGGAWFWIAPDGNNNNDNNNTTQT